MSPRLQNILMEISLTGTNPEVSILSPDILNIDRLGLVSGQMSGMILGMILKL